MIILGIILISILQVALVSVAFILGFYLGHKKSDKGIKITEDNSQLMNEMAEWLGFGGK